MIEYVHSYMVHPSKNAGEQPGISGTPIQPGTRLHEMLTSVFDRATQECTIEIQFRPDDAGEQRNECRSMILDYARNPSVNAGRCVAERLQQVTTNKSGLGLLFLMKGNNANRHTVVISRFPADQGIIAQEHAAQLSVEFIERVFMKNARSYKSVVYASDSFERGFWQGNAIDRQIAGPRELSDYWIRDFLLSDLRTTGPAGTKRLAVAIREAVKSTGDLEVKQQLISASNLLRGQDGQSRSARQFIERLGLTQTAINAIEDAVPRRDLLDEVFQFDRAEFDRHALYRAVQLDNGALLVAEDARFGRVFTSEPTAVGTIRYSTEGKIVDERLRKSK